MKVHLRTIGCRLNQSEIETMGRQLLAAGHDLVTEEALADKVIVNTCAVTAAAARDARALTRRIHRANEGAEIFVTGCYATVAPQDLERLGGVARVIPNGDKDRVIQMIDPHAKLLPFEQEPILREFLAGIVGRTRAFVKVQDGCDNRCTFCITTIARGKGRSRPLHDVVAEVQALASAGYNEAVLTGVHLGSYGRDQNGRFRLGELVAALLKHTDIPRLRLSSLEPWDITPRFFALWQNSRLLPHLHLPLQSGCDRILRRMGRRTSRAAYKQLVSEARSRIPHLNLSTDVIVGFPGETELDFERSLEYVGEIAFSRLHVFSFNSRPGTAAANMKDQVRTSAKKARARRMIELGNALSLDFYRSYEGETREVLWEANTGADAAGLRWQGYTDNYIRVSASGPAGLFNSITQVRLTGARPDGMSGRVLPETLSSNGHVTGDTSVDSQGG